MVKIVVIGVGRWGSVIAKTLAKISHCNLVAVCDIDKSKAKHMADLLGTEYYFDYKLAIENAKPDAVVVATPAESHYEIALYSIRKGKNVFVEKPICDSSVRAEKLIKEALKAKVKLMVGHIERFNPAIQCLRDILSSEVGNIIYMNAQRVGRPKKISSIGVTKDLAIHDIDIARFLLKRNPKYVFARCGSMKGMPFDDWSEIAIMFDEALCHIEVNWISPFKKRKLTIIGEKSIAVLDYLKQELMLKRGERLKHILVKKSNPLVLELSEFINCIAEDRDPLITGVDGVEALKIAELALRSSKTQEIVRYRG